MVVSQLTEECIYEAILIQMHYKSLKCNLSPFGATLIPELILFFVLFRLLVGCNSNNKSNNKKIYLVSWTECSIKQSIFFSFL